MCENQNIHEAPRLRAKLSVEWHSGRDFFLFVCVENQSVKVDSRRAAHVSQL